MKVLEASLSYGDPARGVSERLSTGAIGGSLACFQEQAESRRAAISGLLAELLLGGPDNRWAAVPAFDGQAHLATRHGELRLNRSTSGDSPRLSLTTVGPREPDAPEPGPADWQSVLPADVLAAVFFCTHDDAAPLKRLLSSQVAETFTRLSSRQQLRTGTRVTVDGTVAANESTKSLLVRRDELAAQIESLLAERRREGETLAAQIEQAEHDRRGVAARVEELRRRVESLSRSRDAFGARRRYEEVSRAAAEAEGRQAQDQWAPRVEDLDQEVARWRDTLAELESREAYVRGELARLRPDDTAPQLLLADQRASVAVAARLIADLEAEVARFARTGDSPHCLCAEAHPRLNPLVETLGRHVEELSRLVAQQEAAQRTQDLLAEARQLDRSQAELRRQLDHLLGRRQTLWRSTRARIDRTALLGDHAEDPDVAEGELRELAHQLAESEAELAAIDRTLRDAVKRRARMLDDAPLEAWQRELARIQADLARGVGTEQLPTESLRASEVLARLTDGEWTELRLAPGGRHVEARDRTGRIHAQRDLKAATQRLVAWALRLALADACHAAGAPFVLIADQPFAGLDSTTSANLATCLDDYARRGRQVLLFSEENSGVARLRSLGIRIGQLTGQAPVAQPTPQAIEPLTEAPSLVARQIDREEVVTRPCLLDIEDPIDRFPVRIEDGAKAFARARVKTVGDLISGDPSAIAEEMASDRVTAELISLWQAHAALVAFTPGLDMRAAKRLVDCDILSVEELAEANAEQLARALAKRGADAGVADRAEEWVEAASDALSRWKAVGYAEAWRRNRAERRERIRENSRRRRAGGERQSSLRVKRESNSRQVRENRKASSAKRGPRFYLETNDDIEKAPSIGPKRANQLRELGVRFVSDLLAADPEDLAQRLDNRRIDAATIVAWQHQSSLMIRVAGLRGHDAQVLVGCGFTSPEEIAGMKPAELLEFVDPFCDSPEGQRALRGSDRPDLAEVTEWIRGARERRAVGAA